MANNPLYGSNKYDEASSKLSYDGSNSELDIASSVNITGNLTVSGNSPLIGPALANGTDIADTADALALSTSDLGKTFLSLPDASVDKTVTLPTVTAYHVGQQITVIQNADLVAGGVLKFSTGTGTFATNSFAIGYNSSRYLAATRPAAANNLITISGADTNSAWGIGSVIVFTVQAAGEWCFQAKAEPLGTGNNAIAYSTA